MVNKKLDWPDFKLFSDQKQIPIQYVEYDGYYEMFLVDSSLVLSCFVYKDGGADVTQFESSYKSLGNKKVTNSIEIIKSTPFADPLYRTKHNRKIGKTVCPNGGVVSCDYILSEELYASGGTMVVKNAQIGDWIEASVYDALGLIPEPYRAASAEAWPVISSYIVGQYLEVYDSNSIWYKQGVDTRPLVAKIPAGMSLRVVYHAEDILGAADREFYVNYFLHKKL